MVNIYLFLSIAFAFIFFVGILLEKIKLPWIFSALILGIILSIYNPFSKITSSPEFNFFAELGMYFLLFVVGLEMDFSKLKKSSSFIFKGTFIIITLETIIGSLLVHFGFGYGWIISIIVASSFSTVGEAVIVPVLDEFKIINTKLGQSIIGIGVLDDIFELGILVFVSFLIGAGRRNLSDLALVFGALIALFILTIGLRRLKDEGRKFANLNIEMLFFIIIAVLFLFIGVGAYGHLAAISALLAGLSLRSFIPHKRFKAIESEIKTMCYGFFAPIFFLWVGVSMDVGYIVKYPVYIILILFFTVMAKLAGSFIVGVKNLGAKESILLGLGLSVRFSTSIVIVKILFENNLIGNELYSVIIASSIILTFCAPLIFSALLSKWQNEKHSFEEARAESI